MKTQIKPLTSLRFIFAIMVFMSHLKFNSVGSSSTFNWLYANIFTEGYLGVSFFFILSGFVLSYSYKEKLDQKEVSKRGFYIARFARIYPLHLLTFIIAIPLTFKEFGENIVQWVLTAALNIGLLQSFIPVYDYYFSFNLPTWSISNEMFFYLLFPLFATPIYRLGQKTRLLSVSFLLLIIISMGIIFLTPEEYYHRFFYVNPLFRITDFILGIMLYSAWESTKHRVSINFTRLEVSSIVLFGGFFLINRYIPQVFRFSMYYWIPMCFLIYSFSFQKGLLSRLLSSKVLVLLGEISFGFYMIHFLVLRYMDFINEKVFYIGNEYVISAIALFIALITSYITFKWFEQPMNKFIRKRFS